MTRGHTGGTAMSESTAETIGHVTRVGQRLKRNVVRLAGVLIALANLSTSIRGPILGNLSTDPGMGLVSKLRQEEQVILTVRP
jgi:hypothetical protein